MDTEFPTWLRLIVAILASWRITHLLAYEDGPGGFIVKLRLQLGSHWLGSLMDCFGCLVFWVAAVFVHYVATGVSDSLASWFGIAGGAFLLQRLTEKPLSIHSVDSIGEAPSHPHEPEN